MPIDDVNNLAKYKAMIENATTLSGLEDAYNMLTAAYQRGDMSYQAYMSVYAMYEAKHNLPTGQWPTPSLTNPVTGEERTTLPEGGEGGYPYGAYVRGLQGAGLNAGMGGGEFGRYLQSRFAPTAAVYRAQKALLPGTAIEPENAFEQYARGTRGGNLGQQAQSAFQGLLGKATSGNWTPGDPFSQLAEQYNTQANLGLEASRGRLGAFAASQLLPSEDELISGFRAGPTATDPTAFLSYLKRALGL